ncbi:plasmid-related transcriptional repressor protein [Cupriavidus basilensis]|uniref:plasmid-related transcriptional repressor protein n=1 Tax=Cupriavidus basilensis TaxID=68895 RepID=UPI002849F223|nr:plasmid-related transcriptional repressor protein [Cupriavidus basilensis]MDR3383929.1 plasmid-related transcriptional repressor protein [Cupriavidus basilensis]
MSFGAIAARPHCSDSIVTRIEEIRARRPEAERRLTSPVRLFIPGLEEFMRAMPNHIARSSLFAPVARGRKKMHTGTILVSRADAVIKFWGEQLDEAQADVWMQAMHEAIRAPLGESVTINRAAFLRAIGRDTGNWQYGWLHRTMLALTFAMLVIEATKAGKPKMSIGHNNALHMIEGFTYNSESEEYILRIDPRWRTMFGNREFALIDWDKRLQIKQGQDMAKALQRLIATSSDTVQRHALDWLRAKMQYNSPMRKFRDSLTAAMKELERLDVIGGSRIEVSTKGKEQAVWNRIVGN